ncbi:MAG: excalibur calcium-binding domain-containing protein, partial [Anaerolineae bacterium]|nr:excalibur calcium-binding domain-containing protein [Anaerolineae bacterium]
GLGIDPVTGQVVVNPVQAVTTAVPGLIVTATVGAGGTTCPSLGFTCSQLFTCQEARACLAAGNFSLDPDNDGIPCEDVPLNCT